MTLASLILAATTLLNWVPYEPETWEFTLKLDVPRVYNNTDSLGYRKYQKQTLKGRFTVEEKKDAEPIIGFEDGIVNKTHKVNGECVTYYGFVEDDGTLWHGIGNNKTEGFTTRSVELKVVLDPSYSIGPVPTEDNSLYLTLAGKGNARTLRGSVAGRIGCACQEYGHKSPTRIWGQKMVDDKAAVFGTWTAKRIK